MPRIFAYGSNMHLSDVRRWLAQQGFASLRVQVAGAAVLPDHALVWNYRSATRRGGAANVVPRPGAEVRGVLLEGDAALLAAMDLKEAHPTRYDRGARPVDVHRMADGDRVAAWLYRVTPAFTSDVDVPPRAAYLRLLIEAAREHELGAAYVAALQAVRTVG